MQLKSTTKTDTNRYELLISIDAESFADAVTKAYKRGAAKMTIPGFRKGHAPRAVIEKMYGEEVFYEDALNILYPSAVNDAVAESGLDLADDHFDFDLVSIGKEGVEFKITCTVKPEVTLKQYKEIKAEKPAVSVSAEEVKAELARMQEKNARIVSVEGRPAEMGDTAVIDFEGFIDGKAFPGGKGDGFSLELGSGQFIPGFEEQVAGHNTEEEFDVNVSFPEDYHAEELKGKPAVFKVKLHEIKKRELPELDDEFAKDVSEFDTLADLKKDLKEKLLHHKTHAAEDAVEEQLINAIIDGFEGEIPDCMIDRRINENVHDFEHRLQAQGLNLKTYLQYTGMDMETFKGNFREGAERQVKIRLALEKIAQLENITASPEEIQEKYDEFTKMYQVDMEQVKLAIPEKEIAKDIQCGKAIDFVKSSAVVSEAAEKKPAKKTAAKKTAEGGEEAAEKKPAKKSTTKKAPAKSTKAKETEEKSE